MPKSRNIPFGLAWWRGERKGTESEQYRIVAAAAIQKQKERLAVAAKAISAKKRQWRLVLTESKCSNRMDGMIMPERRKVRKQSEEMEKGHFRGLFATTPAGFSFSFCVHSTTCFWGLVGNPIQIQSGRISPSPRNIFENLQSAGEYTHH